MRTEDIFALGLGLTPPWQVLSQRLDTEKAPHELHLVLGAERGATYPCPTCGRNCKAHDFEEFTWRHLNFFQHHCYLTARVARELVPTMARDGLSCRGRGLAATLRYSSNRWS